MFGKIYVKSRIRCKKISTQMRALFCPQHSQYTTKSGVAQVELLPAFLGGLRIDRNAPVWYSIDARKTRRPKGESLWRMYPRFSDK